MKKRVYLMPLAAILAMIFTVSCSKEYIEGSYSREDSAVVEDKDSTATSHGGNAGSGTDINSGDGMVDDPVVDGWDDGDSVDMIVS